MADAGLLDYTGFRRGTDVWFYAEAEPDRRTAFGAIGASAAYQRWGHEFRDVIAGIEAPGGGLIWPRLLQPRHRPSPRIRVRRSPCPPLA